MRISELQQLTIGELQQLTILDLESDVVDILKRYDDSKLPLTPQMVKKLTDMSSYFPKSERSKFSRLKTIGETLKYLNYAIEFCEKTGLKDLLYEKIPEFLRYLANALKELP